MRCQVLRVFVMCVCYHNRRCTDKMIKMMHKAITLTRTLVETKKTQREMKANFFLYEHPILEDNFLPYSQCLSLSTHTHTLSVLSPTSLLLFIFLFL